MLTRRKGWVRMAGGLLVATTALLAGCDFVAEKTLRPGQDTEADVRQLMGKPEMVWEDERGNKRLEYPRGAGGMKGSQTWFVTIDAAGKYVGMEQAMQEKFFSRLKVGMTRDDVRATLGKAHSIVTYKASGEEVWTWRYEDSPSDTQLLHVHFNPATGLVVKIARGTDTSASGA